MGAFFIGLAAAIVIGAGALLALNFLDQSSADAFYTRYTVPLDDRAPTDGSLSHSKPSDHAPAD